MNKNENMTNTKNDNNMSENNLMTEEQLADFAADLLNDHAQHLSAVTLQRLSTARSLAVNQLAVRRAQEAQGVHQSGNVLQWLGHGFGGYFEQHRIMSTAVIVGAMLLTFFAVKQLNFESNLESSDAFLLASELPPEAFADKGFDTWLVSKRE